MMMDVDRPCSILPGVFTDARRPGYPLQTGGVSKRDAVRAPALPFGFFPPGRRFFDRRARRPGKEPRDAGARAHRPRQHVRRPRFLQGVPGPAACSRSSGRRSTLAPGSRLEKSGTEKGARHHHLVLLARNLTGYANLLALSSLGYTEGFYYKPRDRRRASRAPPRGADRAECLPRRGHPRRHPQRAVRARRGRAPSTTASSSARTASTSRCRTTGSPSRRW